MAIHTATHDCDMGEPRCAPVTPGGVVRREGELRAEELLAESKMQLSKRKGMCRGEREGRDVDAVATWNLAGGHETQDTWP